MVAAIRKKITLAQAGPERVAQAYWQTVLLPCKRNGDSTSSLFYSEKQLLTLGRQVWRLTELKGPFTYSPVSVKQATAAERLNGLLLTAEQTFTATHFAKLSWFSTSIVTAQRPHIQ